MKRHLYCLASALLGIALATAGELLRNPYNPMPAFLI